MKNSNSGTIKQVFRNLDSWRHLPAYRLEPRVAPFFALFLREVLSKKFKIELHELVIPEFPLRIGTLQKTDKSGAGTTQGSGRAGENQSYNVDYLAFTADFTQAFLVELKTDMESVSDKQQCYLRRAAEVGIGGLIGGILEICKETKKQPKYVHLLHRLSKLDLVSIPDGAELYDLTFPEPRKGWSNALRRVEPTQSADGPECEVVYIQPKPGNAVEGFKYVYFDEMADIVKESGDLGGIFAQYLRKWTAPAGQRDPRDITQIA